MAQQADRQDISCCRTTASACTITSTSSTRNSALCYVRVPTWLPCRLQIYFNGHNWLASQLRKRGIDYSLARQCLRANRGLDAGAVNRQRAGRPNACTASWTSLRSASARSTETSARSYHWSVDQCEYATDIVFRKQADLQSIYENLARTAIHTVKPDNIATFLGRKLSTPYEGEMGNRFNIRIEGTRIKHTMGPVSIKLYDKFGLILRIETTVNDLTFFKHYREVEHRDGSRETKWASMQKTIYSLPALRELLQAANRRYLEFLSAIEDPRTGRDKLDKLSQPSAAGRPLLSRLQPVRLPTTTTLFCAIARGEFNISGLQNKSLRRLLSGKTSRARCRGFSSAFASHGLIQKGRA